MSGSDLHLPPEISTQILTKLPVKSVVRFRCACKTWYSLVSCPNFISAQTLDRSTGVLVQRVNIRRRSGNCLSSFSLHDESFVESDEQPDVPDLLRRQEVQIVGSCDGLICFAKHSIARSFPIWTILIWNPSIRKLVELPPHSSGAFSYRWIWGFGFDSESRDYKVVRIVYPRPHVPGGEVVAKIHIFDLRKGVWRSLSSPLTRPCYSSQHSVYLHGNLHWACSAGFSKYILMSFDLSGEVLHEMEVATDSVLCPRVYPRLYLINGMLSMALVSNKQHYCSVWSMKEYGVTESWTKLFDIEMPYKMNLSIFKPSNLLQFWENGEVLLVDRAVNFKDRGDFLVLYNPESRKSISLLSPNEKILDACFYKESLVLL